MNGLTKQSKTLTPKQETTILSSLNSHGRNALRNKVIFLLSCKSGLRSKEIAGLKWKNVLDGEGNLSGTILVTNDISKGKTGGRKIPVHEQLLPYLEELLQSHRDRLSELNQWATTIYDLAIIQTERSKSTSPQVITNFFYRLYKELGLQGYSSHSGRRTFITNASRKISLVKGSLRDVQYLAGHSNLATTQRYIETNEECHKDVLALI